ncbi:glyoxylase-like metal-dependent hydrolase (beta-lactamase superfamily II) [Larkinella arboricola]|uniref:Glyoxylase-like metal-dependent hydrolase (Beta-lactamase superfamily II) n=1 Tax=Larkinella arboricola TaxID=643671 RepID=A0A327WUA0_LARAB|nr:MBL fold metallo-hydrolase [Larkinella arboricola]RAJ96010.1 glyoxylase-like metal-dependent hydrolase (beta-lactamase superfamily II) [Larkinella arboricola]
MAQIKSFVFNPFSENTYVLYDETGEAVIIDPGCYEQREKDALADFIEQNNLKPVKLLNTHAHIDHVLGNAFVKRKYGIDLYLHESDLPVLKAVAVLAPNYGMAAYEEAEVDHFLEAGQTITFGNTELEVRFVPGHAPGHVAFVNHADRFVIGGDVLFRGSIGRTDFPLSDFETLARSIRTQFYTLPDDYTVYPGHMGTTTIGQEKKTNPFIRL